MAEKDTFIKNRSVNENFLAFLDIVIGMLSVQNLVIEYFNMSGYDLGDTDKPTSQGITVSEKMHTVGEGIRNTYEDIREKWPSEWKSWDTAKTSFQFVLNLMKEVEKCKQVIELAGAENDVEYDKEAMLLHMLEQIILRAQGVIFPPSIQLYRILNWVKLGNENSIGSTGPEIDATGQVIRYPYRGITFNKDGLDAFFNDPADTLKKLYFNSEQTALLINREIIPEDLLLKRLRDLLLSFEINAFYGFRVTDAITVNETTNNKIRELSQTLTTWFSIGQNATLAISLRREDDNRIMVTPYLEFQENNSFELQLGNWHFDFDLGAGVNSFMIGPDGIELPPGVSGIIKFKVVATRKETKNLNNKKEPPAYLIGTTDGTRLEIGKMDFTLDLDLNDEKKKADIRFSALKSGFYLMPGDGDSFLKKILPEKGLAILFDLAIGYSNDRGFYLDGSGGGEIYIPVNKKIGKLTIPAMQIGIRKLTGASGWMAYTSLSLRTELGPVSLEADKIGMRLLLNKAKKGTTANLGIVDADFDFKPPDGVGIEIKAKVISGGGYLYFDKDKGEYFGVAQLKINNKINVKAIGIIQTKLPDGSKGYSFLLLITAEFPAVQLGLGFSLAGVGGLIGIQRTIKTDKLQEAIYSSSIDDILFPKDPLKNVYSLINKINSYFPAADDQYTFGLMAKLFWGPKNIISIELGLIIEFPEPVRFVMIGVLRADINKKIDGKDFSVLKLQVNIYSEIDFEKKLISFDAALFESTLLSMKLEGQMALRISYGSNPDFAVSIGGFHPRFQPPALNLPASMKRLKIVLKSGNPEITVFCYLAVTSNTIQFGIGGLFKFNKWGVGIRGELSFDALFQLSPFRFETDVHLLLAASWKGYDFASIEVNGTFSGPSPWHIQGSLKLKAWIFSKTVSLEETWGENDETRLDGVNVLPLIAEDLKNPGNWERIEGRTSVSVTLRKDLKKGAITSEITMHPNELLTIRQNIVPLGPQIDKYSGRKPRDAQRFDLSVTNNNNVAIVSSKIKNHFASAQFIDLTEEQQLSVPPYELFDSGISFDGLDDIQLDDFTKVPFSYEKEFLDEPGMIPKIKTPHKEGKDLFEFGLLNNALSNSVMGQAFRSVKRESRISEQYVIVNQENQSQIEPSGFTSKAYAIQVMKKIEKDKIYNRSVLTVKPKAEVLNP